MTDNTQQEFVYIAYETVKNSGRMGTVVCVAKTWDAAIEAASQRIKALGGGTWNAFSNSKAYADVDLDIGGTLQEFRYHIVEVPLVG